MNNFETLREIGVKEIAKKTHIEPQIIGFILDKNYDALAKYNACGHIKIIVREFNVDMSEWLCEYAAAVPNSQGVKSCGAIDKIPPFTDSADGDIKPAGRGLVWLGFFIFLVAVFVYFFSEHIGLDKFIQNMQDKKTQITSPNSEQVEQAKRNLNETNEEIKVSQNINENAQAQSTNDGIDSSQQETQEKVSPINQVEKNSNSNQEAQIKEQSSDTQYITPAKSDTQALQGSPKKVQTVSLKTLKKVWVGIINLNSKSKKSYDAVAGREFVIDLNQTQLIVAGNGNINLIIDDKKQSFNPNGAVRFLVKDGDIKQISYDEFVALNGGKSW